MHVGCLSACKGWDDGGIQVEGQKTSCLHRHTQLLPPGWAVTVDRAAAGLQAGQICSLICHVSRWSASAVCQVSFAVSQPVQDVAVDGTQLQLSC